MKVFLSRTTATLRLIAGLTVALAAFPVEALADVTPLSDGAILAGRVAAAPSDSPARRAVIERQGKRVARYLAKWDEQFGAPLAAWAKETIAQDPGGTVFYPFSGPDLATVSRIYPAAGRYVFVAYQKAGRPPHLADVNDDELHAVLTFFEQGLWNFAKRGYFITTQMNDRLRDSRAVEGVLGTLLLFAELEGYDVLAVEPIRISPEARVVRHDGDPNERSTWNSARLRMRRRSDGAPVTLDYVRIDLLDRKLTEHPEERAWLERVSHAPTFLKAASHLLQRPSFSFLRDTLLATAPSILQDETALRYDDLAAHFDVRLFGTFRGFHDKFDKHAEAQLLRAYREGPVTPLPFRLGYDKARAACLQYAWRRR